MVADTAWRELCSFDDPALARAVATSIASMEFDVRLSAPEPVAGGDRCAVVVEVVSADWEDLADVLDEIIEEQREFDRVLAARNTPGRHARIVTFITLSGAADLLLLLGLIDW